MVLGESFPLDAFSQHWPRDGALLTMDFRDAFAGGFVAGIVEGKSLEQSIDQGHWLASLSIKELGPQYVPPRSSICITLPHMIPLSQMYHVSANTVFTPTPYFQSVDHAQS